MTGIESLMRLTKRAIELLEQGTTQSYRLGITLLKYITTLQEKMIKL